MKIRTAMDEKANEKYVSIKDLIMYLDAEAESRENDEAFKNNTPQDILKALKNILRSMILE